MKHKLIYILFILVILEIKAINEGLTRTGSFSGEGLIIPLAALIYWGGKLIHKDIGEIKDRINGDDDE